LSPAEVRELLGAYALGALDDDEREQVERLVLDDQEARAELHALQLGAAWLARSDLRPAPRVWDAIQRQMEMEAPAPAAPPAPPVSLDERRQRRRGRRIVAFAAAAVLAAGVVVAVASLVDSGPEGTSVEAAAHAAIRDPDAEHFDLRAPDGRLAARLAVYEDGRGYLADSSLPSLDDRHAYQLWAITNEGPVSAAVLGRSPHATELQGDARAPVEKYAITVERAGGNPTPTGAFVASTGIA
jgi:anti-sigma-K factor RskA